MRRVHVSLVAWSIFCFIFARHHKFFLITTTFFIDSPKLVSPYQMW